MSVLEYGKPYSISNRLAEGKQAEVSVKGGNCRSILGLGDIKIWAIYETVLFVSHDKILSVRFLIDRDVIGSVFWRR